MVDTVVEKEQSPNLSDAMFIDGPDVEYTKGDVHDAEFCLDKRGSTIYVQVLFSDGRCGGFKMTEEELLHGPNPIEDMVEHAARHLRPCMWMGKPRAPIPVIDESRILEAIKDMAQKGELHVTSFYGRPPYVLWAASTRMPGQMEWRLAEFDAAGLRAALGITFPSLHVDHSEDKETEHA